MGSILFLNKQIEVSRIVYHYENYKNNMGDFILFNFLGLRLRTFSVALLGNFYKVESSGSQLYTTRDTPYCVCWQWMSKKGPQARILRLRTAGLEIKDCSILWISSTNHSSPTSHHNLWIFMAFHSCLLSFQGLVTT